MNTYPVKPIAGMHESITNVMSQPIENAIANPAINIPTVIKTEEFFYPSAPW